MSRGYAAIGLMAPKREANLGGVVRAAGCYDASMIAVQGIRYKHQPTDPQKTSRHIPIVHGQLRELIPFDCVPVAVELIEGAESLVNYKHPERAFYIFGPEDSSLGRATTQWCRDVVMIPTRLCMNLAATVNVVLYDRLVKS